LDLGGDWNIVELKAYRSSSYTGIAMTRSEKTTWSKLMLTPRLKDIYGANDFLSTMTKYFTWQGKWVGNMIFSRIHRFYCNLEIHALSGNTRTWPTLIKISDYTPVHCTINKVIHRSRTKATFHSPLLHPPKGHAKLKEVWSTSLAKEIKGSWSARVEKAIHCTMKCSNTQKQRDAIDRKAIYREQFKSLTMAETALESNWEDE